VQLRDVAAELGLGETGHPGLLLAVHDRPKLLDHERGGVDGAPQVWIVDEAEARRY